MRKDVLDIILKQMSQNEVIAAFMRIADLERVFCSDFKMEWALGLYPNIDAAWLAEHDKDIKKWVTKNFPNIKEMQVKEVSDPWSDVIVKALSFEEYYIKEEDLEQFNETFKEVFEDITLDNAQEKIDAFYKQLRERGISYSYYSGEKKKKASVYAVRTIDVDRDYINSLDKKSTALMSL